MPPGDVEQQQRIKNRPANNRRLLKVRLVFQTSGNVVIRQPAEQRAEGSSGGSVVAREQFPVLVGLGVGVDEAFRGKIEGCASCECDEAWNGKEIKESSPARAGDSRDGAHRGPLRCGLRRAFLARMKRRSE